jgi:type IV/VI secretion system ImpK/VasF family protein
MALESMKDTIAQIVYPVFTYGLQLRDRLDRGLVLEFELEQENLLSLLQVEDGAGRSSDYRGDGTFLGIRYALACWLDEIFIRDVNQPWDARWSNRKMETEIFGTTDRFWKFWEQAERARTRSSIDAVEAYYYCVMLGFRGQAREDLEMLREWAEAVRTRIGKSIGGAPEALSAHTPTTNVPPLRGRNRRRKMVLIGGVTLLALILAVIISVRLSQ